MAIAAPAQYFGQNKVNYRPFDFTEWWTPHFNIHHYFENREVPRQLGIQSERWYALHNQIFRDTFQQRNPMIFYANHGDFQQTTAIGGRIGVGTGGVTEGLRTRVVMPVMPTHSETNHVLGHEMVHVFQYRMFKQDSVLSLQHIQNIPLWMIEGLAEYLSIGRIDPHTAIWLRDAVAHDKVPTIKDLNRRPDEYFPYRYGHAFWSFVCGTWGDGVIKPLLRTTGSQGLDAAIDTVLKIDREELSSQWQSAISGYYQSFDSTQFHAPNGQALITPENSGNINIAPNLSPDGKHLLFLSEKDVFTIDYFLADAENGQIKRKVASTRRQTHIDALNFAESAGAWSPDNEKFAFVIYSKGQNLLKLVDTEKDENLREMAIPNVRAFRNPTWSPNGSKIVVSGLESHKSDLYRYDLESRKTENLTNDPYSDIQPAYSPDGSKIVFATNRLSQQMQNTAATDWMNLAILDVATGEITNLPVFPGANNLNPVFSSDSQSIYFLSDRDGFRDLYRYDISSNKAFRLTNLYTGITGITTMAPAISVASEAGTIAYTWFNDGDYHIYTADPSDFDEQEVALSEVNKKAAVLPPEEVVEANIVTSNLSRFRQIEQVADSAMQAKPYSPGFKLEYAGNTEIGVASSAFGTGAAGGISLLFGDILGHNKLYTALALNGEIYDASAQLFYLNQKSRIQWGIGLSHIPIRFGSVGFQFSEDTLQDGQVIPTQEYLINKIRIFEDRLSVTAHYPFNRTKRLELGSSFARYYYQNQLETLTYTLSGFLVDRQREELPTPPGFNLYNANAAYVGDNAYFGVASPLDGYRYRLQADRYFGRHNYWNFLVDARKYFFLKPLTVAFRSYNISRVGIETSSLLTYPLFAGYPNNIRGYYSFFFGNESSTFPLEKLLGNTINVGNVELRLPLSGPERLALIRSRYFLTELNLFADAALAWNEGDKVIWDFSQTDPDSPNERAPVFSAGVSLRVNLFGQLVLEPFYAFPFQHPEKASGTFGLNMAPGW